MQRDDQQQQHDRQGAGVDVEQRHRRAATLTGDITNYDIEVTHEELTTPHALGIIAGILDEHL